MLKFNVDSEGNIGSKIDWGCTNRWLGTWNIFNSYQITKWNFKDPSVYMTSNGFTYGNSNYFLQNEIKRTFQKKELLNRLFFKLGKVNYNQILMFDMN